MTQVTIDKVFKNVKETKFGAKLSVGLKVKEATAADINGNELNISDKYINGWFKKDFDFKYQAGDKVDILLTQRGEYLDFTLPEVAAQRKGSSPVPNQSLVELERKVKILSDRVDKLEGVIVESDDDIDPDDF